MEKDSKGGSDKKRSSKEHAAAPAALDPSLFAHSLFGGAAAGFNPMMMPGFPMMPNASTSAATSAAAAHAALASMAGNPALGANAAWLSLMHQMAAQDYLSRLQSGAAAAGLHSLAGLSQYEALTGMKAPSGSSGSGSGSGSGSSSSKAGPKVPGTTNRGRKKTISLDPPYAAAAAAGGGPLSHGVSNILGRASATETRLTDSVTITPTSSKSTSDRLRQLEMLGTKVGQSPSTSAGAQVTITPVAAKGTTMLTSSVSLTPVERGGAARSPPAADGPLNLSKKHTPAKKRSSVPDLAGFPGNAAAAAALGLPLTPEQQMDQLRFHSAMASAQKAMAGFGAGGSGGGGSGGGGQRRSRAKKLGVGVSRPKKNTVASLLANSRGTMDDGSQPGGSGALQMSTDELTIEVRPRSSTAPAATAPAPAGDDEDSLSVMSAGSSDQRKHKVTSSTDEQLSSFPYSSYLARLKREYEDSSGLDSEDMSDHESECEVSSSRGAAGSGSDAAGLTPSKRRRVVTDERKLRVPLDRGWRRETTIRKITQAGPRGDVVYYAPCGKAFRQFPDILRYLERNNISDVTRDHFTFSSKVVIGDYLKISEDGEECIPMSETEVKRQVDALGGGIKKRQFKKPYVINIKSDEGGGASGSGSGAGASTSNYHQAMELMRQLEDDRRNRQLKEEQKKKERELKNLQMLEERRRKQEELEKQKAAENLRKAQELNKQREMLYMLEVERERRRHHMLLVKALDTRRRQEERDRRREDMKVERAALKERRREKRLQDAEVIRQLKKPREDMALTDQKPLPELPRIPGLRLSGEAFANCLMVFEFLHNFGETLGFDMESLPSLGALQQGLMNEPDHEEELLSVLTHLVVCAVEDPGIPHPVRHVTVLNQTLRQADITHTALSEVLRIYMFACASGEVKTLTGLCQNQRDPHCRAKNADFQDAMDDNRTYQMSQWLSERPYLALNPTEKTEVLAHLCNDLLQNKAVLRQIDSTIEVVNSKRKEKWNLDGRLRRMRMLHAKKFAQRHLASRPAAPEASENGDTGDTTRLSELAKKDEPEEHKEEDEDDEDKDESAAESEAADEGDINDEVDVNSLSAEELHKRIEQVNNHNNHLSQDIYEGNRTIRPTSLGQDRFHRAFWVLPRAGGIYVEGLESGVGADERYDHRRALHLARRRREAERDGETSAEKRPADSPSPREGKRPRLAAPEEVATATTKTEPMEAETTETRLPNGDAGASPAAAQNGLSGGESPRVNGAPVAMETDVKAGLPVKTEPGAVKAESPAASRGETVKLESPAALKTEPASEEVTVKSESSTAAVKPEPAAPAAASVQDSLSAIKHLAENPVTAAAPATSKPAATTLSTPSHTAPLNNKHLVSYLNASLATLGANGALKEVNGAIQIPGLGLVPSQYLLQALQAPEKLWFSLLPKEPCDFSTITELSEDEQESVAERGGARPERGGEHAATEQEDNGEDEAQDVPKEYMRGWWRVSDAGQIDQLVNAMHNRGIRERPLKNKIQTCKDTVMEACELANPAEITLSAPPAADETVTDDEAEGEEEEEEEEAEEAADAASDAEPEGNGEAAEAETEEKSDADAEKKAEKAEKPEEKKKPAPPAEPVPEPDVPGSYRRDVAISLEMSLLEHVENLEERIAQASMQFKTWRLPPRTSGDRELFAPSCEPQEGRLNAVTLARDRLVDLEQNIERRYLKPPLGTSKGADLSLSNLGTEENNTIPRPLLVWRDAVPHTTTAAQVSMCLYALEMSVAWDKSIMKANCQFCTSGDHEEKLLLCDGCDKGYHTYCFKPAMDTIPDGDWYCFECVNKATGERACVVCGKGEGKVLLCEGCPRAFHPECVTPPVAKVPRGKWHCPACAHKSPKKSRAKKAKPPPEAVEGGGDAPAEVCESPPKKERGNKKLAKEMAMCRTVLAELESHDEAWPFLLPVNTKQFPTYKKIIKSPMDLSTIKKRINEGVYKSKDEFTADMRVIFNNCETFNEDDSPVGKAGHSMRTLFESRWLELNPQ